MYTGGLLLDGGGTLWSTRIFPPCVSIIILAIFKKSFPRMQGTCNPCLNRTFWVMVPEEVGSRITPNLVICKANPLAFFRSGSPKVEHLILRSGVPPVDIVDLSARILAFMCRNNKEWPNMTVITGE